MEKEIKILDLPLKKEWYNMIESGIKKEEYREIKPYWCNRLLFMYPFITQYWEGILERVKKGEIDFEEVLLEHGIRNYTHIRFRYGVCAVQLQIVSEIAVEVAVGHRQKVVVVVGLVVIVY